ncbi:CynX/NimT family MFS transporter [Diaphorobacter sp. HDW4A]|uniref:cyanate transporter n=1 Tax=Diaphorobacter sp. HDW4A TaxID=2714924 RepID=UPI00140820D5|nr:cyanate transporter [Diaphorobacter sp. HDW4A]QIL80654.1 CynX/NimT family MFS transporter [Diaphorobacter sp. HDW4A]
MPSTKHNTASASTSTLSPALWVLVVVAITINLRPFLTAVGPLGQAIRDTTGMNLSQLSWLTLLPMALMGVGAWVAPAALRVLGARTVICGSLLLIALGCALRMLGASAAVLLATAAFCGAGVALIQGILPGAIKRESPRHVAQMMGLYSCALMGGGAFGAQISPLAMQWGWDWRAALSLWTIPVLIALPLAWYAFGVICKLHANTAVSSAQTQTQPQPNDTGWLIRRPRTWLLMACFGLVNGGYAAIVAWLAPFYQTHGWSAAKSGTLVAILSIAQATAALTLPALAARHQDRRPWIAFTLLCQLLGFAVLIWWPDAAPTLNAILLGVGLGGCFALMMVVALDHLPSPSQAGALNALMQGGGFLLASLAPWVIAQLHEVTGKFESGWMYQLGAVCVVCVLVARLSPSHYPVVMKAPSS